MWGERRREEKRLGKRSEMREGGRREREEERREGRRRSEMRGERRSEGRRRGEREVRRKVLEFMGLHGRTEGWKGGGGVGREGEGRGGGDEAREVTDVKMWRHNRGEMIYGKEGEKDEGKGVEEMKTK